MGPWMQVPVMSWLSQDPSRMQPSVRAAWQSLVRGWCLFHSQIGPYQVPPGHEM